MIKQTLKNSTDEKKQRVIERPDGFYWADETTGKESGPFVTLLEAEQDMQGLYASDFEEGIPLHEAEDEIGITDWIDPDTGDTAIETAPRLPD